MTTSYEEALRRRLGIIQDQGESETQFVQERMEQQRQLEAARREAEYRAQLQASQNAYQNSAPVGMNTSGPVRRGGKGPTGFDAFMAAIGRQESGGNYGAVNKDSGASGKYQIMPANIGAWSQEALGKSISRSQFLGSPELQEKIARFKLQQYYNMYGAAGAAVAWYAGPGNAKKYVASKGKGYNKSQGKYPSVSKYVADILARMGLS